MSHRLWLDVDGSDYSAHIQAVTCTPAGPGVVGGADLTLLVPGGGLSAVQPLAPYKLAIVDATTGHFVQRLLYGVIAVPTQTQDLGTNLAYYHLQCTDSNIVGAMWTPLTPAESWIDLPAGHYDAQVAAVVAAVQAAWGGTYEALQTIYVPDYYATMPAVSYEGGHTLDWYLAQLDQTVRELTGGTSNPEHYWGLDSTAGPSDFGAIQLLYYDSLAPGLSILSLSDTNHTIRRWERILDAASYYGRRDGVGPFPGGMVHSVSASPLVHPWSGGGWVAAPLRIDVTDTAEAQALLDADVLRNGELRQTTRPTVLTTIAQPGDTVDVTLALTGQSGDLQRVVDTRGTFRAHDADKPEWELTLGTIPRRLGETGRAGGGGVVLHDVVPPVAPTSAPTVLSNAYDPPSRLTRIGCRSVTSISADTTAARLRWVIAGLPNYTPWVPCAPSSTVDFPLIYVLPGALLDADVECRDTSGNVGLFGPSVPILAASIALPNPPTITLLDTGTWGDAIGNAWIKVGITPPGTNTADHWQLRANTVGGEPFYYVPVPVGTTTETEFNFVRGVVYKLAMRGLLYGVTGAESTEITVTAGKPGSPPVPVLDGPPSMEQTHTDDPGGVGVLGWYADTGAGGTVTRTTSNVALGTVAIRLTT